MHSKNGASSYPGIGIFFAFWKELRKNFMSLFILCENASGILVVFSSHARGFIDIHTYNIWKYKFDKKAVQVGGDGFQF